MKPILRIFFKFRDNLFYVNWIFSYNVYFLLPIVSKTCLLFRITCTTFGKVIWKQNIDKIHRILINPYLYLKISAIFSQKLTEKVSQKTVSIYRTWKALTTKNIYLIFAEFYAIYICSSLGTVGAFTETDHMLGYKMSFHQFLKKIKPYKLYSLTTTELN